MNERAANPNPTDLDPDFGFDLDDEAWIASLRGIGDFALPSRIGPYELLGEAGRGGQGVVFRARQPRTGRVVALKRLAAGAFATPEMRARFDREVAAVAALEHPNLVTIYSSEVIDGQPVLAMQWIDGAPIDRWARPESGEPRSPREVLEAFVVLCDALEHAHARGLIHRDLKPSNILVDRHNRPFVLDFGLAKWIGETKASSDAPSLTCSGHFLGTPAYAPPEVLRGDARDADARTDVYALGAVLYRALTGACIVEPSADVGRLLAALDTRDPRKPSELDARLDNALDAVLLKATARAREQRYESIRAFRADLERYLAGQPVLAPRPNFARRAWQLLRRNRRRAALAAGLAALLAGAALFAAVAHRRAGLALSDAEQRRQAAMRDEIFNRAIVLESKSALGQAESLYRELLAGQPAGGAADADAAIVAGRLGRLLRKRGEAAEAGALLAGAFETLDRALGPRHPETAAVAGALAELRFEEADYAAAEKLYAIHAEHERNRPEGVAPPVPKLSIALTADYVRTGSQGLVPWDIACGPRIAVLELQERWTEAIELTRECIAARAREIVPRDDFNVRSERRHSTNWSFWLGIQQRRSGDEAAAQRTFEDCRAALAPLLEDQRRSPKPDVELTYLLRDLGGVLVQLDRLEHAEALLQEALVLLNQPRHRKAPERRAWALALLGDSRLRAGRHDEAETLLLEALPVLVAAPPDLFEHFQRRIYVGLRLIELYDESGRPSEARRWREQVRSRPIRAWTP